jgi:molybdopterin synthase sulfur carrier subunit
VKIRVFFFASLREQLGSAGGDFELPDGVNTVDALRAHLRLRGPAWQAALADGRLVRAAVNQEMVGSAAKIAPGDEIAFFPPVTGG